MIIYKYYKIEVVLAMFPYEVGLGEAPGRIGKLGKGGTVLKVQISCMIF